MVDAPYIATGYTYAILNCMIIGKVTARFLQRRTSFNCPPDKFILTASKDERSKMIREDRIPDVKTVIASDMGLRYLLRNDILTACDDARAELKYQLTNQTDGNNAAEKVDGQELLDLLLIAQSACTKWFDLIDEKNVQEALLIVSRED